MRKFAAALAVLILILSLAGCGKSLEELTDELGEKVIDAAQSYMDKRDEEKAAEAMQGEDDGAAADETAVTEGVEIVESTVVLTLDYEGFKQIHTFTYDDSGYLTGGTVSMDCGSKDALFTGRGYFENANADATVFTGIVTDGSTLTADYTEAALTDYRRCTMEQLAEVLTNQYLAV